MKGVKSFETTGNIDYALGAMDGFPNAFVK